VESLAVATELVESLCGKVEWINCEKHYAKILKPYTAVSAVGFEGHLVQVSTALRALV
jgi:hypothetical protein